MCRQQHHEDSHILTAPRRLVHTAQNNYLIGHNSSISVGVSKIAAVKKKLQIVMGALDNEGLDIDGPDNDGPIVTELPRRSCFFYAFVVVHGFCYYLLLNSAD